MSEEPSAALARAVSALRRAAPQLDATGLAEALWLASRMASATTPPAAEPLAEETPPPAARRPRPRPVTPSETTIPAPRPAPAIRSEQPPRPLHERLPDSSAPVPGQPLALPRPSALPRALPLARALRPWKRPWTAGHRHALDVTATVDAYARSGELLPVLSPTPERWFDVVVVVDRSPSMQVWRETVDAFTGLLDELGAFRTLQARDLRFSPDGEPALTDRQGLPVASGHLGSPGGRRLVVVVSDCAAPAWRSPVIWQRLRTWARTAPVALLNPLPTKLWRRTGLDLPTARALPGGPGSGNAGLGFRLPPLLPRGSRAQEWLALPVLSLSPHSLDRWSRTVMLAAPEGCAAVLVPSGGRPPAPDLPRPAGGLPAPTEPRPTARKDPAARTEAFLRTAAPAAARMAVLSAPFERLSLDMLYVLRQELVPEATTADLAEVLASDLFALRTDPSGTVTLQASAEVRCHLERALPEHEALRLTRALGSHVAGRGHGLRRMPVVAGGTAAADGAGSLAAEAAPAGRALARTLELLGLAPVAQEQPALQVPAPVADPLRLAVRMAETLLPVGRTVLVDALVAAVDTVLGLLAAQGISLDGRELRRQLEAHVAAFHDTAAADGDRPLWYTPPTELRPDSFWARFKAHLEARSPSSYTTRLDQITDTLMSSLGNPARPGPWLTPTMAATPPQSGRTTTAIGLAAKALDAGYGAVVILAGTQNTTRLQTQRRVDEGLLGYESTDAPYAHAIGVGTLRAFLRPPVVALTSTEGDFGARAAARHPVNELDGPLVFVVKKNRTVVDRVCSWIVKQSRTGSHAFLPLLVIDTAQDSPSGRHGPSPADQAVHRLLSSVPRAAYVSFAYGPFVPLVDSAGREEPLYPNHVVRYFPEPADDDVPAPLTPDMLPQLREVTDDEAWLTTLVRARTGDDPEPDLPPSLREAINVFVLACAIREVRGQVHVGNSMLVSVSRYKAVQSHVRDGIARHVRLLRRSFSPADPFSSAHTAPMADLETLWHAEFAGDGSAGWPITWQQVFAAASLVVHTIQVALVNSDSDGLPPEPLLRRAGRNVIAVGGTKLTQGPALEGLTVGYHLMSASTPESLLRLSNGFSLRTDSRDLCRLYTTPEVLAGYRFLTLSSAFFEADVETRSFSLAPAAVRANLHAAETFVRLLDGRGSSPENRGRNPIWRDVPPELIMEEFFRLYRPGAVVQRDQLDALYAHIRRRVQQGELSRWTVQLARPAVRGQRPEVELGGYYLDLATRKPMDRVSADRTYRIGRLSGVSDTFADLDEEQYAAALAATPEAAAGITARWPSPQAVRDVRRPDQALLTIYLVRPPEGEESVGPLVGFAVRLPRSSADARVS
ncbi:SAV_2336 N-terminal domain-related protein [Streptomyces sp. TRM68416]|uniref:SAV_2336 N-terminal domain-related protein n=1 Tax=Streptomyces sp. TRM68416 TaxID=2758412 RepID=UPI002948C28C|nr:SAV_2336 N-terminal domain-related protein [Streptomyces sp. TRM68416]